MTLEQKIPLTVHLGKLFHGFIFIKIEYKYKSFS